MDVEAAILVRQMVAAYSRKGWRQKTLFHQVLETCARLERWSCLEIGAFDEFRWVFKQRSELFR